MREIQRVELRTGEELPIAATPKAAGSIIHCTEEKRQAGVLDALSGTPPRHPNDPCYMRGHHQGTERRVQELRESLKSGWPEST